MLPFPTPIFLRQTIKRLPSANFTLKILFMLMLSLVIKVLRFCLKVIYIHKAYVES